MTKFMLLQNYGATLACDLPMTEWDPADIKAHIEFQMALNDELAGNGELVDAQGLAGPELAKFVTFDGVARPGGDRRPVPGVQGAARRLPDDRRRVGGAGHRDRGEGVGRAGSRRRADPAADRGARR